ncbi:MAG: hypothetical protein V2A71_06860 [Candidatus Eisenbacteria bacterium]
MKYVAVALVLLSMPIAFQAQAETEQSVPPISIGVRGGFGSYVMSDANVLISDLNDLLVALRFDELSSFAGGPTGGAELRVRITPHIAASLTMDFLYEGSKVGLEVVGEEFKEVELWGSTVPITARVLYVAANPKNRKLVYSAGGGISYLWLGRLKAQAAEIIPFTYPYYRTGDGDGIGFQASGGIEYFAKPWLSVGGELGYRYAKISEIKMNDTGEVALTMNGDKMSLDFSGFGVVACIRFHPFGQ